MRLPVVGVPRQPQLAAPDAPGDQGDWVRLGAHALVLAAMNEIPHELHVWREVTELRFLREVDLVRTHAALRQPAGIGCEPVEIAEIPFAEIRPLEP